MFRLVLSGQRKDTGWSQTREYRDKLRLVSSVIEVSALRNFVLPYTLLRVGASLMCHKVPSSPVIFNEHTTAAFVACSVSQTMVVTALCPAKIISSCKLITYLSFRNRNRREITNDTFTCHTCLCPWVLKIYLFIYFNIRHLSCPKPTAQKKI